MTQFLTRSEVAEMFKVGVNTISTWCTDGTFTQGVHFSRVSNKVYFSKAELLKLLPGNAEVE